MRPRDPPGQWDPEAVAAGARTSPKPHEHVTAHARVEASALIVDLDPAGAHQPRRG